MKLVVALEHRFVKVRDQYYSSVFTYEHSWSRYLRVFDEVHVLARVEQRSTVPQDRLLSNASGVSFIEVPSYRGPRGYVRHGSTVRESARIAAATGDVFVLRLPGMVGTTLWKQIVRLHKPYGVEVVGDPWDVFAPSAIETPLRPLYRRYFARVLGKQCEQADVAAYVTEKHLQQRYPNPNWTTHYSSVRLPADAYLSYTELESKLSQRELGRLEGAPWSLVHVGTMDQTYKRQDLLIDATARLRARGFDVGLTLVGDGVNRGAFEGLSQKLGVSDVVRFAGRVTAGDGVASILDESDLFVLSSDAEGLPRVLMEAGARGLPIVATSAGGTWEFVGTEELVEPGNSAALADRISAVLADTSRFRGLSRENLRRSRLYEDSVLAQRSQEFCLRLGESAKASPRDIQGDA